MCIVHCAQRQFIWKSHLWGENLIYSVRTNTIFYQFTSVSECRIINKVETLIKPILHWIPLVTNNKDTMPNMNTNVKRSEYE